MELILRKTCYTAAGDLRSGWKFTSQEKRFPFTSRKISSTLKPHRSAPGLENPTLRLRRHTVANLLQSAVQQSSTHRGWIQKHTTLFRFLLVKTHSFHQSQLRLRVSSNRNKTPLKSVVRCESWRANEFFFQTVSIYLSVFTPNIREH